MLSDDERMSTLAHEHASAERAAQAAQGVALPQGRIYQIPAQPIRVPRGSLPEEANERMRFPMADGLLDYFPNALAAVAEVSRIGNEQHNPGQPMHWARGKSTDHRNKMMRHLIDAGKKDKHGVRHSAALAWRALANLQEELEREEGAPLPRGARLP